MKLLITGCGRSGTKYITRLLNNMGVCVRHEKCGTDGTDWRQAKNINTIDYDGKREVKPFIRLRKKERKNLINRAVNELLCVWRGRTGIIYRKRHMQF